mmetsp:Transcript_24723/g.54243  ORF Transcript_24723/g.54243 Transcript_24723/m.54243 type:complete len:237 (+) Transcript_24723:619-1329(+)
MLRLDPNKSQTTSIEDTTLAKDPADQKSITEVHSNIVDEADERSPLALLLLLSAVTEVVASFGFASPLSSPSSSSSSLSLSISNGCSCCCSSEYSSDANRGSCSSSSTLLVTGLLLLLVFSLLLTAAAAAAAVAESPETDVNRGRIKDRTTMSRPGMTSIGKAKVMVTARHIRPTMRSGSFSSKSKRMLPEILPVGVQGAYADPAKPMIMYRATANQVVDRSHQDTRTGDGSFNSL